MDKLRIENVTYRYSPGTYYETVALNDVTIGFETNKITGLIGHTGSGKSTLVQLFNGLIKPDSGKVLLDGEDIWEKPKQISNVRFKVGLVMQYPEYQLFEETVAKDIAFGPRNMGMDENSIKKVVAETAEIVGLAEAELNKSPFDLSGGQKRRAAIAGVMAMRPEVLVLDEPAAGLDPEGRESIFSAIDSYRKKHNSTVVIVSHSMEDMARWCDNIVVMSKSEVIMSGTRDEIFERSSELAKVGLDGPQITRLVMILKKRGIDIDENIYTVSSAKKALFKIFEAKEKE